MKYYLDTEFREGFTKPFFGRSQHFIDLISIGIVCEDGRNYYAISKDFDIKGAWNAFQWNQSILQQSGNFIKEYWLRDNVLKPIYNELFKKCLLDADYVKAHYWTVSGKFCYDSFKALINWFGKTNKEIAGEVREFCEGYEVGVLGTLPGNPDIGKYSYGRRSNPEFYGYFADYDWVLFCSLFGRMMDLPATFPMYCRDLKQMLDDAALTLKAGWTIPNPTLEQQLAFIKANINYPKQYNEHDAVADAKWNQDLHKFLIPFFEND